MAPSLKIDIQHRRLHFRSPAATSRGVYTVRDIRLITIRHTDSSLSAGIGECSPLPDLSSDYIEDYDDILRQFCDTVERTGEIPAEDMRPYPSMLFGLETAMLSLEKNGSRLSDTPFARGLAGIPINGLVWMGTIDEMLERLQDKLASGFRCIKFKIGAIDFDKELDMVAQARKAFGADRLEIRLDANGAFLPKEAAVRLGQLAPYNIHSIEQPIRQGQWKEMARLCKDSPIPIALDEELIGINKRESKAALLDTIKPGYIIIKPTLHGGISGTTEWIDLANERAIGNWITSALESNVGLNSVAHLAARVYGPDFKMPQGLGTGQLFTDNIEMPLLICGDKLWYTP